MAESPAKRVREFHETYKQPIYRGGGPTELSEDRRLLRLDLVLEEVKELVEASGYGIHDVAWNDPAAEYDKTATLRPAANQANVIEMADALGDIVYVCYGMALEMGINLDDVIAEIHRSNMSKLDSDGKPIYRDDGKVLKGPNYHKPNIAKVVLW